MELLPLPEHNCHAAEVWMHCGEFLCSMCYSRHQYTQHGMLADYLMYEGYGVVSISEWLELFRQQQPERRTIVRTSAAQRTVDSMSYEQLLQLEATLKLKMNKSFDK